MDIKIDKEKIVENVKKNLKRKRAPATGIGNFAAVNKGKEILLITRKERGSIIYGLDLTGKKELPGGGVDLEDFTGDYQEVIFNSLKRELREETGLELIKLEKIAMLPAWLGKEGLIDLAFVVVIPWEHVKETPEFKELYKAGEANFYKREDIEKLEITSMRMKFMIIKSFEYLKNK